MLPNLRRRLFMRLLVAWFAISAVTGVAVYWYETERIDDRVVGIVLDTLRELSAKDVRAASGDDRELARLHERARQLAGEHFVVIELYAADRRKLLEFVPSRWQALEEELAKAKHAFPLGREVHYEKHLTAEGMAVVVVSPLLENGEIAGFFEGVYIATPEQLAQIREDILMTLILVMAAVLLTTIVLYPVLLSLHREVLQKSADVLHGNLQMLEVMGSAIAKRDSDTNLHNYRVTLYAVALGQALGCSHEQIRGLIAGAFLHDVGKIGIPDAILLKPGKLTEDEFAVMQTHVALGVDIVRNSSWLRAAGQVVEFHHEKFDGRGYLRGLSGEDIPLVARIFAVVDVFDALTSERPYKKPFSHDESLAIIERDAGSHFDPQVVAAFSAISRGLMQRVGPMTEDEAREALQQVVTHYYLDVEDA